MSVRLDRGVSPSINLSVSLSPSGRQIAVSLENSCSVLKRSALLYPPSASTAPQISADRVKRCGEIWDDKMENTRTFKSYDRCRIKSASLKAGALNVATFIHCISSQFISRSPNFMTLKLKDWFHLRIHGCNFVKEAQWEDPKERSEDEWSRKTLSAVLFIGISSSLMTFLSYVDFRFQSFSAVKHTYTQIRCHVYVNSVEKERCYDCKHILRHLAA